MSFDKLSKKELYRSAIEDFAVDVKEDDSAKVIKAALLESGVTWADYVAQHPEHAEEPVTTKGVVTSDDVSRDDKRGLKVETSETTPVPTTPEGPAIVVAPKPRVVVAEKIPDESDDLYLIKMERDNVAFEARGHRFTQENPYALMNAEDAQFLLSHEDGFRRAWPEELAEYYG